MRVGIQTIRVFDGIDLNTSGLQKTYTYAWAYVAQVNSTRKPNSGEVYQVWFSPKLAKPTGYINNIC